MNNMNKDQSYVSMFQMEEMSTSRYDVDVLLKFFRVCVCVRERERQRLREKQSLDGKMLKVISSEFLKSMQSRTQMPMGQPSNLNV